MTLTVCVSDSDVVWGLLLWKQQIKREGKRIHISGCRWNERLKVNTDVSKRLTHTGFIIKDDTRVPHVWCPVNSPHYHTCSDFEFFSKKKHFPSLLEKDLSPLCRDIPPGVLAIFFLLKKSNGLLRRLLEHDRGGNVVEASPTPAWPSEIVRSDLTISSDPDDRELLNFYRQTSHNLESMEGMVSQRTVHSNGWRDLITTRVDWWCGWESVHSPCPSPVIR